MKAFTHENIRKAIYTELDGPGPARFSFRDQVKEFLQDYRQKDASPELTAVIDRFLSYIRGRGAKLGMIPWDCLYLRAVHTVAVGGTPRFYKLDWNQDNKELIAQLHDVSEMIPELESYDRTYGYIMCLIQFIEQKGIPVTDYREIEGLIFDIRMSITVNRRYPCAKSLDAFERAFYQYAKKVMTNDKRIESNILHWVRDRHTK